VGLEHLEGLLDEVADVEALALRVVNLVAKVGVVHLQEVHHGEDLAVVGDEGLADGVGAGHEGLEDFQGDGDDLGVTGVQGSLDRDNELGNNGEHFGTALLEHVEDALHGEEAVGVLLLTDAFEEDGQVVMVVELHNVDLPLDFVLRAMLDGDGEISTVVETTELRGHDGAAAHGTSAGLLDSSDFLGLEEGASLATNTHAFLKSGFATSSNGCLSSIDVRNGFEALGLLGHVVSWEITEARVLRTGEELVEVSLPGLTLGAAENLLEVVLSDHLRGVVDLGHRHRLNT